MVVIVLFPPVAVATIETVGTLVFVYLNPLARVPIGALFRDEALAVFPTEVLIVMGVDATELIMGKKIEGTENSFELEE